jgi:acyl-CoA thioesterase FadM
MCAGLNQPAVTARAETKFHKPVPVGADVIVKAWVVRNRWRIFEAHAEIRMEDAEGTLLAETNATMFRIGSADAKSKQEEQEDVFA